MPSISNFKEWTPPACMAAVAVSICGYVVTNAVTSMSRPVQQAQSVQSAVESALATFDQRRSTDDDPSRITNGELKRNLDGIGLKLDRQDERLLDVKASLSDFQGRMAKVEGLIASISNILTNHKDEIDRLREKVEAKP